MPAKEKIMNVPNALTMLRMLLIPVYWALFIRAMRFEALAVFVIASLTDLLDGYIARKYNLITSFGKLMDPLADKLMVISVMLSLAMYNIAPWSALIIIGVKELLMVVGGVFLLKKGTVVYSKPIGKIAQAVTVGSLILCFFSDCFKGWAVQPHLCALWLGVGLTLIALCFYAYEGFIKSKA